MAFSSTHRRVVGDEGQAAGALDGHRHLPLVLGAVPRDPPRDDLPPLGHEVLQHRLVLEVGVAALLGAEAAHLLAAEASAPTALLVVAARSAAAHPATAAIAAALATAPPDGRPVPHRPRPRSGIRSRSQPVRSCLPPARVARSGLLRRLLVHALPPDAVPRRPSALRGRPTGVVTSPDSFTSSWTGRLSG